MEHSLKVIRKYCWISLAVSAAAFTFLLLNGAEAVSVNDRQQDTLEIQGMTNVNELQIRAIRHIGFGSWASDMAQFLTILSLFCFLVTIACMSVCLFQLRRVKKGLGEAKSGT
jgi:hypothetical protein